MNKTININLGGLFFHIDENAFQKLNRYLDAVSRSLSDDPQGKDEIIADIEARISELLSEKIKDVRQVVNENDIEEIITIMGQPEDYSDYEVIYTEKKSNYNRKNSSIKKIFRDGDDKFLGGVCSGLAYFLNIDTIWIRLAFIILTFSGFPVFVYILLWILLPEAKTTSEKLQMEGEPVNISNIEKKIRNEIETLSIKFKDGANELSDKISGADYDKLRSQTKNGLQDFLQTIGEILSGFFKIFGKFLGGLLLFIAGVTLIALFFGLFSVGSLEILNFGNGIVTYPPFFYDSILPKWLLTIFLFVLIGIPFVALFTLGLRIISPNIKKLNTTTSFFLLAVWLVSLFGTTFAGIEYGTSRAYNGAEIIKENIIYNSSQPLKISVKNNDDVFYLKKLRRKNNAIEVIVEDKKRKYSNNIKINIEKSETGQAYIEIKKGTEGRKRNTAKENAKKLEYNFKINDNQIVFDAYFLSEFKNMWKDEEIESTLYIPAGTIVYFENSSKSFLYDIDNIDDINDSKMVKHNFKMTSKGFECIDCEEKKETITKNKDNHQELEFLYNCTINDNKSEFIIDKKTTKSELKKLINWFKNKQNIDIEILKSTFRNNMIKELKLHINCNDGYEGEVYIGNSTLKTIPKGFVRRYDDKETPFKTW